MPLISFIPEKYEEGFNKLASLEVKEFEDLKAALSLSSLVSSLDELVYKVVNNKDLDAGSLEEIFSSVGSLIPFLENEKMIEEVVQDICSLSVNSEIIEENQRIKLQERLDFLLRNKHIYYASKAFDLKTQYGNIFLKTRILTDIRPIFDIDVDNSPVAGIIQHSLSIHYQSHEEPYHKDITFVIDLTDIKSLLEALTRALEKEKSLRTIFEKSGMTNLND